MNDFCMLKLAKLCESQKAGEHRFRQIPDFHVATRSFDKNGWGKLFDYGAVVAHSIWIHIY